MRAPEQARRHKRARYMPVASNRGGAIDPMRSEKLHPNWCACASCESARRGPAGRGRRGGCAALFALALAVIVGGIALAGVLIAKAETIWAATPPLVLGLAAIGLSIAAAAILDAVIGGPGLLIGFFGQPGSF